jgi:hypothetical protein
MQQRIGPESPGLTRFFAARAMVILIAGFYVAGLVFVFLYSLGVDPVTHGMPFSLPFSWPSDWPFGWPWTD